MNNPTSTPDTFVVAMSEWMASPASTPPDTTLFAVGDIHGRLDLLCALQHLILEQANESDTTTQCIVYLGDYIDKAQSGFQTVEDGSPRRRAGATLYGFRTTVT